MGERHGGGGRRNCFEAIRVIDLTKSWKLPRILYMSRVDDKAWASERMINLENCGSQLVGELELYRHYNLEVGIMQAPVADW